MVLDVRGGGGGRRHVLAILPGNRKLDFNAAATLFEARNAASPSPDTAQELTGCVMGAVPPFALNPDLAVVVEEDLLANETLFFNAGRLDRSMELDTKDWIAAAQPRIARIACAWLTARPRNGDLAPASEADFEPLLAIRIDVMREHSGARPSVTSHRAPGGSSASISISPACA